MNITDQFAETWVENFVWFLSQVGISVLQGRRCGPVHIARRRPFGM